MDSFRESMDLYHIVVTNPYFKKIRFVLWWRIQAGGLANPDSRIQTLRIRIADSFRRPVFERFGLFSRIQRILSTIAQNESLRIQAGGLVNPDSRIWTLRICIADLFCRPVFERFVSWIRFVRPNISKDSIHFISEGFVYESRILKFYTS